MDSIYRNFNVCYDRLLDFMLNNIDKNKSREELVLYDTVYTAKSLKAKYNAPMDLFYKYIHVPYGEKIGQDDEVFFLNFAYNEGEDEGWNNYLDMFKRVYRGVSKKEQSKFKRFVKDLNTICEIKTK